MRWPAKDWFVAHKIHKMEPAYVVSAKFIEIAKVFATGTTSGEVKLWDNRRCDCVGVLNSVDWDPRSLMQHMGLLKVVAEPAETPPEAEPTQASNGEKPGQDRGGKKLASRKPKGGNSNTTKNLMK